MSFLFSEKARAVYHMLLTSSTEHPASRCRLGAYWTYMGKVNGEQEALGISLHGLLCKTVALHIS